MSIDVVSFARTMFDAVAPDECERHCLQVCKLALINAGYPAANLDVRWYRRDRPDEVVGAQLGETMWIATGQEVAELRETIFHEAGHLFVAPGGSAEAEDRARRFASEMLRRQGWL